MYDLQENYIGNRVYVVNSNLWMLFSFEGNIKAQQEGICLITIAWLHQIWWQNTEKRFSLGMQGDSNYDVWRRL